MKKFRPIDYPEGQIDPEHITNLTKGIVWFLFNQSNVKLDIKHTKFCGNCLMPITWSVEKKPIRCGCCKEFIDWTNPQTQIKPLKCPKCGYEPIGEEVICPYHEEEIAFE